MADFHFARAIRRWDAHHQTDAKCTIGARRRRTVWEAAAVAIMPNRLRGLAHSRSGEEPRLQMLR